MRKRLPNLIGLLLLLYLTKCQPDQRLTEDRLLLTDFGEEFALDRVTIGGTDDVGLVRDGAVPALLVRAESQGKSAEDPRCIGYFFGNEASWGDDRLLASSVLKGPRDQAAKVEFANELRKQYRSIEKLNEAWETSLKSWEDLLDGREVRRVI